jgi:hypothetical protein
MRTGCGIFVTLVLLTASGCSRQDANATAHKTGQEAHETARQIQQGANKAAHDVARETKKGVDEAGRELHQLGQSARQGWNDADRQKQH